MCCLLDDGLAKFDAVEFGVVLHMPTEYHVLVKVPGIDECTWLVRRAHVVGDMVLP